MNTGDYLIIDGYNVINAWIELANLQKKNLDDARQALIKIISDYAAYRGYKATIVFDANNNKNLETRLEKQAGLEIVFTKDGETADSYIEKMVYEMSRFKKKVFVVTSDGAEQMAILGAGAFRISAREFKEDYTVARKEIAEKSRPNDKISNRAEIDSRIDRNILHILESMRRKK